MNLYLVTSPFQLLCAIEAKQEYKTKENILLLREERADSAAAQMRLLLNRDEWDHIIFLGRRSKIWEARKLQSKLKRINPSLSFNYMFYADYSAWRTNVLLNNVSVKREVMFDDGIGTVREFNDKIQPRAVVSRNKASRDFLLKLVGLKPARKIYPRDNFSFFTFFELPNSEFPLRINRLRQIRNRLSTSNCFSSTAPIGFIGQGMVATKGIKLDYYVNMLKELIAENGKPLIYFPHRTEENFVKEKLETIEGLTYHQSKLPLELEISQESLKISKIYGISSTASVSLGVLYPEIEIIDLSIPIKHYELEAYGKNFHFVAKQLRLQSIELE
ncbi:hypothetical protein [Vibrio profundi]|uniref:hypothetical protein n=1 Tax=Vibrio profundi TaxID=1774960 RepID=UPI003736694C